MTPMARRTTKIALPSEDLTQGSLSKNPPPEKPDHGPETQVGTLQFGRNEDGSSTLSADGKRIVPLA